MFKHSVASFGIVFLQEKQIFDVILIPIGL